VTGVSSTSASADAADGTWAADRRGVDDHTIAFLAEVVRRLRRALDLSQRELARVTGVPKSTVADLELGRGDPRLGTVLQVMRAVGLTIEISGNDGPVELLGPLDRPRAHVEPRDAAGRRFPAHLDVRYRGIHEERTRHTIRTAPPDIPLYAAGPQPSYRFLLRRDVRDVLRWTGRFGLSPHPPWHMAGSDGDAALAILGPDRYADLLGECARHQRAYDHGMETGRPGWRAVPRTRARPRSPSG
jgi:transcriptional regulator with XRE-family HTH domain